MDFIRKDGKGFYGIYIAGELVTVANNPAQAQEKFAKETARAQMNAQRATSVATWNAQQVERAEVEYSRIERLGMVAA
jgi:hypothetical protein